jgi:hypothetical protein
MFSSWNILLLAEDFEIYCVWEKTNCLAQDIKSILSTIEEYFVFCSKFLIIWGSCCSEPK